MSTYTTGELAKQFGISVRTLQYYDRQGLLPATIGPNGRRQYSQTDAQQLQLILLLKGMGLKLAVIKEILTSKRGTEILDLMLDQQVVLLKQAQTATEEKLKTIRKVRASLVGAASLPIKTIQDMEQIMKDRQRLRQLHVRLIGGGLLMDVIEVAGFIASWKTENWWIFGTTMGIAVIVAGWLVWHYFQSVCYVCPNCQTVFQPRCWTAFWAGHSPKTRKLTCPNCHQTGYCVEVIAKVK